MFPLYYKWIEPQAQFSSCLLVVLQGEGGRETMFPVYYKGPMEGSDRSMAGSSKNIDLRPSNGRGKTKAKPMEGSVGAMAGRSKNICFPCQIEGWRSI